MDFRRGDLKDLPKLKELGIRSWAQYKENLTPENWENLLDTLNDSNNYSKLLKKSECLICENSEKEIIGMAFLVPNGNPDEIYEESWCHLRFVSVDPKYRGMQIGEKLTKECIKIAERNNEKFMALHTAEIMESARHIYEKIGFRILKEIEPRLGVRYWLYIYEIGK